jgi:3-carboxy-cis,cis-muconate cycloisomerase
LQSDLFDRIFVPAPLRDVVSDDAWLQAMLDVERALAAAEAGAGVIPAEAARTIADACMAERLDAAAIGDAGRDPGNPVEPLVRALRSAVGGDAADFVHRGATSQDILDTAAMLVSGRALDLIIDMLTAVAGDCARLAEAHRSTPIAGRTLLQQAVPTTFGLKAAGWLAGVLEAGRDLRHIREERLAVQLGGAAGTLSALGDGGLDVVRRFSEELGLREPLAPWHTNRVRIGELGAALAVAAGAVAKIGLDVGLMSQTEVAEVAESGGGVSSTMPQKRNPVGSVLAIACARQVNGHVSVLLAAIPQEHERAAGAWHAEWPALSGALAYTGGAVDGARGALAGLEVDPKRMRANLDLAGGLVMAERASSLLADRVGRGRAYDLVVEAAAGGRPLAEELDLDAADLEPEAYLGAAEQFVDRALSAYRDELR